MTVNSGYRYRLQIGAFIFGAGMLIAGCNTLSKEAADVAQSQQSGAGGNQGITPVDVAIARPGTVLEEPEYTGTTAAVQQVSLRTQVKGQVRSLKVDVGDVVKQGQVLAQLDDTLLQTALKKAEAELASRRSEVARAEKQVSNARAQVEQARLELQQAQADSRRQQRLLGQGAVAAQEAEQARTTARTAVQALRAAQEQVRTEQQAVAAAQGQVVAQQAVIAQEREQLSYSRLVSPLTGVITQRLTEEGNLIQPNDEVFQIGDFSRVQVNVEVSELELAKIRLRQSVAVRLDAFPDQTFRGQVSRISPAADPKTRLVPVEVVIANTNRQIGSGLLARVSFEGGVRQRVVVPQTAISQAGEEGTGGEKERQNRSGTIFIVTSNQAGTQATVTNRAVTLGEQANGKVEILSGLKPGEQFVARSGRPLKNNQPVRLSILSETAQQEGQR